jgi:lipoprotein-anchoring transpeptidase ErfK/SrfK
MKRRVFVATGLAAATLGFARAPLAHDEIIPEYDVPPEYMPQEVKLTNGFAAGEIHVDPAQFALFWTLPEGRAIRYTVGIGRPGLYESGEFYVGDKREWPYWTPTPQMIEREPDRYGPLAEGMNGGLDNPLGARALYLYQEGRGDTYLRIHGTNDPSTIARRVSNGCARLVNTHLIDLYNRVPIGTKVYLYPAE